MIRVALRFDDPSALSDRPLEEQILAAAQTAGVPLTVAVIPCRNRTDEMIRLTAERASHLVQAQHDGIIEVAQHGYCHEPMPANEKPPSEFRDVAFERQLETIRAGRSILEEIFGQVITGFVPPWNTFDGATTRALAQSGFRYLSAGQEIEANCRPELAYLPRTCQMTTLLDTLDGLDVFVKHDPIVIAVMHHYDFIESGNSRGLIDLDRFGILLENLRRNTLLQLSTLSGLVESPCASLPCRLRQNTWNILHWRIQDRLPRQALFRHTWPRLFAHSLLHSR